MAVNMLPDFTIPVITAVVVYPGASPEELESTIIKPIEDQVELIDGIDYTTAYARKLCHICDDVQYGRGCRCGSKRRSRKIAAVQLDFPDAVEVPLFKKWILTGNLLLILP